MVEGICKSFLQLFLVGMDGLTMNFAIQKLVPMDANQTLNEYNKVNATKVSNYCADCDCAVDKLVMSEVTIITPFSLLVLNVTNVCTFHRRSGACMTSPTCCAVSISSTRSR